MLERLVEQKVKSKIVLDSTCIQFCFTSGKGTMDATHCVAAAEKIFS